MSDGTDEAAEKAPQECLDIGVLLRLRVSLLGVLSMLDEAGEDEHLLKQLSATAGDVQGRLKDALPESLLAELTDITRVNEDMGAKSSLLFVNTMTVSWLEGVERSLLPLHMMAQQQQGGQRPSMPQMKAAERQAPGGAAPTGQYL